MDYDVPSVDAIMKDGLNDVGGANAVARGLEYEWDQLEVFDSRALSVVNEGIEFLQKLKSAMENLLDENGNYNNADQQGN